MNSFIIILAMLGLPGQPDSADSGYKIERLESAGMIQNVSISAKEKAFRGSKNKFVFSFGAGTGISFLNYRVSDWLPSETEDKSGIQPCLSTNFRIGYAPSEKFFICWNSRANWFKPHLNSPYHENSVLMGGGSGLGISFFPSESNKDIFLSFLFGYSNLGYGFKPDYNNFGTELAAGAGYVLMDHVSLELSLLKGSSSKYYYDGDIHNPVILNLTLNYLFWKN